MEYFDKFMNRIKEGDLLVFSYPTSEFCQVVEEQAGDLGIKDSEGVFRSLSEINLKNAAIQK